MAGAILAASGQVSGLAYTSGRDETTWFKIRNRNYSQWDGREELFERERERNPDTGLWDSCVMACAATGGRM